MRFYPHGEQVERVADGRRGVVKDIEGTLVNIIWGDDRTREWVHVDDLRPGEPPAGGAGSVS